MCNFKLHRVLCLIQAVDALFQSVDFDVMLSDVKSQVSLFLALWSWVSFLKMFIEIKLIYNVVLVLGVQLSEYVYMHIYIYIYI